MGILKLYHGSADIVSLFDEISQLAMAPSSISYFSINRVRQMPLSFIADMYDRLQAASLVMWDFV
jgi:hypothetical protein